MKNIFYSYMILSGLLLYNCKVYCQSLAVNTTGATANTSAILDISSTSKGMLIPRMTAIQVASITTPATGLLVYVTDFPKGFYYYTGLDWVRFVTRHENGNVPINTTNALADPSAILHVDATNKGILIPRMTGAQANGINPGYWFDGVCD